jgi:hypothetical protein
VPTPADFSYYKCTRCWTLRPLTQMSPTPWATCLDEAFCDRMFEPFKKWFEEQDQLKTEVAK